MTETAPERIFHIATAADWRRTLETGTYTTSTVGRTLDEEGFIHASRRDQVQGVFDRYYRGLGEPLVLLTLDPARLESELRVDPVGEDTYPHVYGPINRSAVVDAVPLDRRGAHRDAAVAVDPGHGRTHGHRPRGDGPGRGRRRARPRGVRLRRPGSPTS